MKVDFRSNPAYVLADFAMQLGEDPDEIAGRIAQLAAYCDEPVPPSVMDAWMPCNPLGYPAFIGVDWAADYLDELRRAQHDLARWADDGGRNVEA